MWGAVRHLHVPFQLLRARPPPPPATDPPGSSFDLERGVGRDFFPEKLLQPQYAQPAVLRKHSSRHGAPKSVRFSLSRTLVRANTGRQKPRFFIIQAADWRRQSTDVFLGPARRYHWIIAMYARKAPGRAIHWHSFVQAWPTKVREAAQRDDCLRLRFGNGAVSRLFSSKKSSSGTACSR